MAKKYVSQDERAKRIRAKRKKRNTAIACCAVFVLVLSFGIVKVIEHFSKPEEDIPILSQDGALVPNTEVDKIASEYDSYEGPVRDTVNLEIVTPEIKMIQVAENGRVDTSYFDDAVFMGDSLADSFHIYGYEALGLERNSAHFMTKKSLSPASYTQPGVLIDFDNGLGKIDPWATLRDMNPGKVYVCIGTNTLQSGKEVDAFIREYKQMVNMIKQYAPNALIYISTIPPTAATVQTKYPNLTIDRIYRANSAIGKMCNEEGLSLLNTYDVLKSASGYLREDIAASDGIHLTPSGTKEWVNYLISHTVYDPKSPYIPGSPYTM
ncbi:MAG: GDSL-type esterase/lipase family protein [Oscillospiraceae bacterium]|nr:GDSL-type esterase/lipase family protein [Oscillospiraceae bacterium]